MSLVRDERAWVWLAVLGFIGAPHAHAQSTGAASELARALRDGSVDLSLRYRYELVDQDDFALDANASVLRTRLTYRTADLSGLSLLLEVDDLRNVGADSYNSTRNGKVDRPVVADPQATELNQLFVGYQAGGGTRLGLGRQSLSVPNRRFVASRNWRLNEQTFDALTLVHDFAEGAQAAYTYVTNVNRVFGPHDGVPSADLRGGLHLLDGRYALGTDARLHGYAYFLDFDEAPELSSATLGLRLAGSRALNERVSLPYAVEYARQRDFADNPVAYAADYIALEVGLSGSAWSVTAGLEILGGSGLPGEVITTPLAGLNQYNGWADQFLAIPVDGLEDLSLGLNVSLGGGELDLIAHDFSSSRGGLSYGSELDLALSWPLAERYALLFRLADYRADRHAADTVKVWLMLSATF